MKKLTFAYTMIAWFVCTSLYAQLGKITVRVLDHKTGQPIKDAEVSAGFDQTIKPGWGLGAGRPNRVKGLTNENGEVELSEKGNMGTVGVSVRREEYYTSRSHGVQFTGKGGLLNRYWRPWNPTLEVKLHPIQNPIPLYVKFVDNEALPTENDPVGYDLLVGDWVHPYGSGKVKDFIFQVTRAPEKTIPIEKVGLYGKDYRVLYDISFVIKGANKYDGFILVERPAIGKASSSQRMLPFTAPEKGFESEIVHRWKNHPDGSNVKTVSNEANYFFRVRTKVDEEGNIVKALYGKIYGDIRYKVNQRQISFTYYINPTPNDRNLEFDPEKNLFENLKHSERVSRP